MIPLWKKLLMAGGAAEKICIEDVFSTYLYTGNGSTQDIQNGIDLANEGGMVWVKDRDATYNHVLCDTEIGPENVLSSNETNAASTYSGYLTSFNSDGFSIGDAAQYNLNGNNYASWSFRKAPRFFDVIEYTGNGVAGREIAHDLGVAPGMIIIKKTSGSGDWKVWHRGINNPRLDQRNLGLESSSVMFQGSSWWDTYDKQTETHITLGTLSSVGDHVNSVGAEYIAYLFAHDPLGPSGDGSDGLIACGSYMGNRSTDGPGIDLGWEPQYLIVKSITIAGNWFVFDSARGIVTGGIDQILRANDTQAESALSNDKIDLTSSGFELTTTDSELNSPDEIYIYLAIRRGPMRVPTDAGDVFAIDQGDGVSDPAFISGFPVDLAISKNTTADDTFLSARLVQGEASKINLADASFPLSNYMFDYMTGWYSGANTRWSYMFRRAPGFMDVCCYTGDGVAGRTVDHNLGAVPGMMCVKSRGSSQNWAVYHKDLTATKYIILNGDGGELTSSSVWNDTEPTSSVFSVGPSGIINQNSIDYITILFTTFPGVSKVGSFSHTNGTPTNVDCGFSAGARFVLVKRYDSTGDWYLWDSERGIVAGDDPYLLLNTTDTEVTNTDYIDPLAAGFTVASGFTTGDYIFLAIA